MQRDLRKILTQWKRHPLRTPLIVRGARQIGKTFTIQAKISQEALGWSKEVLSVPFYLTSHLPRLIDSVL
jgi:predicted AAA+ superfamily ATPase